jgi:hypothetical protein
MFEGLLFMKQLAFFEAVFDNVKVLTYEDLSSGKGLIANFFSLLGESVTGISEPNVKARERVSLSPELIYLKNIANSFLENRKHARRFLKTLQKEEFESNVSEIFPEKKYTLWASENHYNLFLERVNKEMSKLKTRTGIDYLSLDKGNRLEGFPLDGTKINESALNSLIERVLKAI